MDIFKWLSKKQNSKDIAKSRLKFVLVQDRLNCSTQLLEMIKSDILKVISNYMEIDEDGLDIQIRQDETEGSSGLPMLYVDMPIKNMKKTGR